MKRLIKRYNPAGSPPGTLTDRVISGELKAKIFLMDFNSTQIDERKIKDLNECKIALQKRSTTWIQVKGTPSLALLEEVGQLLNLHPLVLEDINNAVQRPKYNLFDNTFLVIFSLPVMKDRQLSIEQISLIFRDNFVLSFTGETDPFEPIRKRIRTENTSIRKFGADYLLYALLDLIIDSAFPALENIGEHIDSLEEKILLQPNPSVAGELHAIKRNLIILRQLSWPQRDVINRLIHEHEGFFKKHTSAYLNDCYEHSIQILDLVESFREITSSMLDMYLSSVSNRLNEIMKVLTIIATIFIPLTFITGIYGMNFSSASNSPWAMPELSWYYGYPFVLIIMVAIAAVMGLFFKKKNWF